MSTFQAILMCEIRREGRFATILISPVLMRHSDTIFIEIINIDIRIVFYFTSHRSRFAVNI